MMPDGPDLRVDAIAASEMVSAATLAALVKMLALKGLLSLRDAREVYEDALHMLEEQQGEDSGMDRIYEAAREAIEAQLRDETGGDT